MEEVQRFTLMKNLGILSWYLNPLERLLIEHENDLLNICLAKAGVPKEGIYNREIFRLARNSSHIFYLNYNKESQVKLLEIDVEKAFLLANEGVYFKVNISDMVVDSIFSKEELKKYQNENKRNRF